MPADLILAKAFCQVDTIHGFRYLDDAGKIMNDYVDRYPEMAVGVNGLSMKNSSLAVDEIRVSGTRAWSRPGGASLSTVPNRSYQRGAA